MFAKHVPVFDKVNGVPLGIIKSFRYVGNTNTAIVNLIVRGTCLLLDSETAEQSKGWKVQVIDPEYALVPEPPRRVFSSGPLSDAEQAVRVGSTLQEPDKPARYLQLVSIFSAPALVITYT